MPRHPHRGRRRPPSAHQQPQRRGGQRRRLIQASGAAQPHIFNSPACRRSACRRGQSQGTMVKFHYSCYITIRSEKAIILLFYYYLGAPPVRTLSRRSRSSRSRSGPAGLQGRIRGRGLAAHERHADSLCDGATEHRRRASAPPWRLRGTVNSSYLGGFALCAGFLVWRLQLHC